MKSLPQWVVVLLLSSILWAPSGSARAQGATADQYFAAGNQTAATKDFTKAVQYYQAALQLKPDHAGALQGLGNCQYSLGDRTSALASYEKALALNPANTQLDQFVQALKAQGAAVPAAQATGGDQLKTGTDLFAQKQYAASIPYLEEAAKQNPANGTIDYYLGYAYAMNRDSKNAALYFYRSDKKTPNPSVKAYADKVKASLSVSDQIWVDAQLSAPSAVAAKPAKAEGPKVSKIGFRLMPGFAKVNLADFKADLETRQAGIAAIQTAVDPSASFDGQVPTGFLQYGLELDYSLSPKIQLGLSYGMVPAGKVTSTTTVNYPAAWVDTSEVKLSGSDMGLGFRYRMGQGKMKPFLGVRAAYVPVKIKWTETLNDSGSILDLSGDFKATAMGLQLQFGLDYALGGKLSLSPYLGYRMAKASGFKGTAGIAGVGSTAGQLVVYNNGLGETITFAPDDPAIAAALAAAFYQTLPLTGRRDLEVNLGGIQGGLMITLAL